MLRKLFFAKPWSRSQRDKIDRSQNITARIEPMGEAAWWSIPRVVQVQAQQKAHFRPWDGKALELVQERWVGFRWRETKEALQIRRWMPTGCSSSVID